KCRPWGQKGGRPSALSKHSSRQPRLNRRPLRAAAKAASPQKPSWMRRLSDSGSERPLNAVKILDKKYGPKSVPMTFIFMKRIQTMHLVNEPQSIPGRNRHTDLPLPKGEGRGEGEVRTEITPPVRQFSLLILAVALLTASPVGAAESPASPASKPEAQGATNVAGAAQAPTAADVSASTNDVSAAPTKSGPDVAISKKTNGNGTNELRMNFRGASLDMVLNYLSEAAGFI